MKTRYAKRKTGITAILWTIGASIWILNVFRSGGSDIRQVIAAISFTAAAAAWWLRWYYCQHEIKNQEEHNHE